MQTEGCASAEQEAEQAPRRAQLRARGMLSFAEQALSLGCLRQPKPSAEQVPGRAAGGRSYVPANWLILS